MNVGIDKMQLYFGLDRFEVRDAYKFKHKRPDGDYGEAPKFWGQDKKGNGIDGRIHTVGEPISLQVDWKGLAITFNPSKLFHPYHLLEVEHLDQCLDKVHDSLNRYGVALAQDLTDARITRIDLAKQAQTHEPNAAYQDVYMRTLNAKRETKRILYPDGYYIGNNSRYFTTYDKTAERKLNGITDVPSNLTRFEVRYNKKSSISNTKSNGLGLGTFEDALNASTSFLTEQYNSYLRNDIFRVQSDGTQMEIPFEGSPFRTIFGSMLDLHTADAKAKGNKNIQSTKALRDTGLYFGIENMVSGGGVAVIEQELAKRDMSRKTIYRLKKEFHEMIQNESKIKAQIKAMQDASIPTTILENRSYLLNLFAA